jgi:hypothetical protein
MVSLYEHGLVELADVALAQAWLADLAAAGYEFPSQV